MYIIFEELRNYDDKVISIIDYSDSINDISPILAKENAKIISSNNYSTHYDVKNSNIDGYIRSLIVCNLPNKKNIKGLKVIL